LPCCFYISGNASQNILMILLEILFIRAHEIDVDEGLK
jgi:hypothetical protein